MPSYFGQKQSDRLKSNRKAHIDGAVASTSISSSVRYTRGAESAQR
jgi:hypothetical protein